jgi:competence protein ComEC
VANAGYMTWQQKGRQAIHQFISLQWRLFILLLPLVLVVFSKVSLLSPWVNLIAIPLLTLVIVPLNLLAWLLSKIWLSSADVIWQGLLTVLQYFHLVLTYFAEWFPQALTPFHVGIPAMLALSVALMLLLLPKGIFPRWWVLFLLIPVFWPYRLSAPLIVHILDVGQGLSVIVQTENHTLLVDAGAKLPSQQEGMGEKVVLPALHALGVQRLDKLMLTHLDNDHSGGAPAVMDQFPVIQLTSNAVFEPYPTYLCEAGQHWVWDSVHFKVLAPWPAEKVPLSANDASCILLIEVRAQGNVAAQRVLIMGDAGFYSEFELQKRQIDIKADVIVLGHHGSKNSSSSAFLSAVAPSRAVVSAGFLNRYHHPAPVVLRRLHEQDIAVDSTISGGTLSYYFGNSAALEPIRFRDQKRWLQRDH